MTKLAMVLLAAAISIGCMDAESVGPPPPIPAGIVYEGGDGSSLESAVVIRGAANAADGIEAEYAWIARQFPGYSFRGQALYQKDERVYDALRISKRWRMPKTVYFDITEFYGKF